MMAWVHASIGAMVGSKAPDRITAGGAGIVSHAIADLVPHRDYAMEIEVPLLLVALLFILWRHGWRSSQFWGAVGGFSPDIENGLEILGVIPGSVFPTHTKHRWFIGHGFKVRSVVPQIVLAAVCLYLAEPAASGSS